MGWRQVMTSRWWFVLLVLLWVIAIGHIINGPGVGSIVLVLTIVILVLFVLADRLPKQKNKNKKG